MWAQIIKVRIKPGHEQESEQMREEILARARQRPGWVRSITMTNQRDPQEVYGLVMFDSEEQARASERTSDQDEVGQRMREFVDGTPEFIDLDVVADDGR
ncbi:MAG: antibiotic biosynthesis monooxygenase family protein [Dehalococcoidia bacterium]